MLDKCKEVMLRRYDENVKNNSYWYNTIDTWMRYRIDEHSDYKALVQAQTPQTIAAFVKKVIASGNHITVEMLPEE